MDQHQRQNPNYQPHIPWNKGKLIGAKPPLRPKHVWSIRTKLQVEGKLRDLAMFNMAIDSKLRGCDVVALKVKAHLRKAAEHTISRLLGRIGRVVSGFSAQECSNFFRHAGYVRT